MNITITPQTAERSGAVLLAVLILSALGVQSVLAAVEVETSAIVVIAPTRSPSKFTKDNRDSAMNKEFDCIRTRMNNQRELVWGDVCYSDDQVAVSPREASQGQLTPASDAEMDFAAADTSSSSQSNPSEEDRAIQAKAQKSINSSRWSANGSSASPTQEPGSDSTLPAHWEDAAGDQYLEKQYLGQRKTHAFDFGEEVFHYFYEEPDIDVKNEGVMLGYYASYTYKPPEENFLNNGIVNSYTIEGRYAQGDLDYTGSGTIKDKDNSSREFRALVGKDYMLGDHSLFDFYVGFAYRYLVDHGNGMLSSTNAYAYDRHSNYYYIPLGIKVVFPERSAWHGEMNVEVDFLTQGEQISDLSNGNQWNGFNNPDILNEQKNGQGARASMRLVYSTKMFDIFGEPFIRYWDIADSEVTSGIVDGSPGDFIEPHNRTYEIGSKFGLLF